MNGLFAKVHALYSPPDRSSDAAQDFDVASVEGPRVRESFDDALDLVEKRKASSIAARSARSDRVERVCSVTQSC